MKHFLPLLLTLIAFSGCSDRPVITDNSTVVVQSGLGISNVCALGMTFEQIRKATGDAALITPGTWSYKRLNPWRKDDRFVLIPSLAAQTAYDANQPIASMFFQAVTNEGFEVSFRELKTDSKIRVIKTDAVSVIIARIWLSYV